jgi:hypothetical protein
MNGCDDKCLHYILHGSKREDLLPPSLANVYQPLSWWRHLRKNLGLSSLSTSLRLSHLYWLVFPEDRRLTLRAHEADVDVIMAIRLTLTYLWRALDIPLPVKINTYFSSVSERGRSGWRMSEAEMSKVVQRLKELREASVNEDTDDGDDDLNDDEYWDVVEQENEELDFDD